VPHFTGGLRRRGDVWEEPSEEDADRLDDAYRKLKELVSQAQGTRRSGLKFSRRALDL
jgi:hypothetical protein